MSDRHRPWSSALGWLVVGIAWPWACGQAVRAEDDRMVEDQPAATTQGQRFMRHDLGVQFEQLVRRDLLGEGFTVARVPSPQGGGGQSVVSATVSILQGIGRSRLARIDAVCGLSPSQRRRLQLAVESDICRLVGDLEAARAKYDRRVVEIDRLSPASQRPVAEFQQIMQRLTERRRTLLGGDSLLAKALPTTLDADQIARLAADTAARRGRRWQVIVASHLDGIDTWLGLDQRQYDELERLLLEKQPPLRVDEVGSIGLAQQHQAEQILAMLVTSEIDASRLRATLSERQWQTFSPWREQGEARRTYVVNLGILEQVPE
jgi:hypothetical protein